MALHNLPYNASNVKTRLSLFSSQISAYALTKVGERKI